MRDLAASKRLQRKRARLKRGALYALVVIVTGCVFGFVDRLTRRIVPKPDYYKLLFTELARQNYLQTGTPTIVKEDEHTLALFEEEYNLRNAKYGFSNEQVVPPKVSVLQYSYPPGMLDLIGKGIVEVPFTRIVQEQARLMIWHNEPGWHPLVVWVYSREEQLLACFVYVLVTPDHPFSIHPPRGDARIIRPIDRNGVVSVQGSIPDFKVFPEHAYLIPLENLKLGNLDPRAKDVPNFWVLYHVLPGVLGSGNDGTNAPETPTAGETLALIRARAMRPFTLTRRVLRLGILPLGVLWFGLSFWRLRKLHQQFNEQIEEAASSHLLGFARFLTADLDSEVSTAEREAHDARERELSAERERNEIEGMKEEILTLVADGRLAPDKAHRIDHALASDSLVELRELIARYRRTREHEAEIARERQREIQWLESEFEAIPIIDRSEIPDAWNLYQQALNFDEAKVRLHWLKEARKKLPREFRAEAT